MELSPGDTNLQLNDTARLGTRIVLLRPEVTAANTQLIIARAHQLGLVTYGEFVATPYRVGVEAGVDCLVHMNRYDLGAVAQVTPESRLETSTQLCTEKKFFQAPANWSASGRTTALATS